MNTHQLYRTIAVLALVAALALPGFAQGLYWESVIKDSRSDEKGRVSRFYYMPKKYKAAMGGEKQAAIIRLDKDEMVMIDNEEKSYWEMSFKEMEVMMKGMGAQMDAAEAQMEEAMKDMSEEQRKMVQEMMGKNKSKTGAEVAVSKTGKTQTINGFACSEYTLKNGDKKLATVWATKDIPGVDGMREDLMEFGKRMAAMMPTGMESSVEKSLSMVDGFPIQTERSDGSIMTVTKVEKRSTHPGEFEPPKGYTKVDPPMGGKE